VLSFVLFGCVSCLACSAFDVLCCMLLSAVCSVICCGYCELHIARCMLDVECCILRVCLALSGVLRGLSVWCAACFVLCMVHVCVACYDY